MSEAIKIYNRLIAISEKVIEEFKILGNLSYMNRENTGQFSDHVEDLKELLEKERIILFNLKASEFKDLCEFLIKHEDISFAYARTLHIVDEFFETKYPQNNDNVEEEVTDDSTDLDEDNSEENEEQDISEIIDDYYIDNRSEKNMTFVISYFATVAIKEMYNRILSTKVDNHGDDAYKKRMLKYFNQFKYYYFMLNNKLELLGVDCSFDLNKIVTPGFSFNDIDGICYNECVTIIEVLYCNPKINYSMQAMETNLFNMIMFEKYIENIPSELISRLIDLCDKISEKQNTFLGDIARGKLVKKRQKN